MYQKLKRFLDIFAAALILVLLFPILLISWSLLLIANEGKPFFFQKRPGLDGKVYSIVKFRTMNSKTDVSGVLLPDNQRLTKVGRIIRKTSMDELPQLINVIKGDMSIVGPRPLLPEYLILYSKFQKRRHEVRPGITGWAQVNGRNAISWDEKFKLDVWYVDNQSFSLDIKILLSTIKKVFKSEGITSKDSATTEKFKGS